MTAQKVLNKARIQKIRIATAESCTGGLLSAALTEIAGSSDVFDRGFVTYSNIAKQQMLGVSEQTLETFGAVSEQVAVEMAKGALRASASQVAISITGVAGPGGSDHKPEGRVCFALAGNSGYVISETQEFAAIGRANVRNASVVHGLSMLERYLES